MKRLFNILSILISYASLGQCLQHNDTTLIHPDLTQNLPPATKDINYQAELYIKDSDSSYFNVSLIGLPTGVSYKIACDSGFYKTIIFEGVPKETGTFELGINVTSTNITKSILGYKIVVGTIGNITQPPPIQVSPNPANNVIKVSGVAASMKANSITITNIEGKIVAKRNVENATDYEFDLSGINAGIYFVNVTHANGLETVKFVKN